MILVALKPIHNSVGLIAAGQIFNALDDYAAQLVSKGLAVDQAHYKAPAWDGTGYWTVEPEWSGATVCIIAGGPSVTPEQVDLTKDHKTIAINNAVYLASWADILYFCDSRWFTWHRGAIEAFQGRRVTLENLQLQALTEVRSLRNLGADGMPVRADGITHGHNSGFQALQLAVALGAQRVLLLGFDMQPRGAAMHWHAEHPVPTSPHVFTHMLLSFAAIAEALKARGVEVINCSPDSALDCFPKMPIQEALCLAAA